MLKRTLAIGVVAGIAAAGLFPRAAAAQATPPPAPVESMYADAVGKETAVRKALADPQAQPPVLRAVRTVVSDYESIVRFYPASGYSDDALWRAGLVSLDAFTKFGDPRDRDASIRLLRTLASQYPSSSLVKHVPEVLALLGGGPGAPGAPGGIDTKPLPVAAKPADAPKPQAPALPAPVPAAVQPAPGTAVTPGAKLATIKNIQRAVLPDVVRITIELDAETTFHEERLDGPSRVFVDFASTRTTAALQDKTLRFDGDSDPVHQIRIGRHDDNVTRIVLDAIGVSTYSVYPIYQPYRLVIDCIRAPRVTTPEQTVMAAPVRQPATRAVVPPPVKARPLAPDMVFALAAARPGYTAALQALADAPEAPDSTILSPGNPAAAGIAPVVATTPGTPAIGPLSAPDRNLAGGFSLARQLGLGVSRIVIDPGHGGHDPGALGKDGLSEAELVLDVSLRLEKLLVKTPGIEVILTRRTDDFVPLQERTAIANREHADLFLSIHANASSNDLARGVETYYLNFTSNMTSAAVAARENAASGQPMSAAPDFAKSIALDNKLDESRDFATDVQRAMIEKLRPTNKTVKDLGVKQAPFMVLIGAAMPSVLAEISFVTNAPEAKLLKGSVYRQRIAEALYAAIRKYQTSLKSVETVAREPGP
jgi:N-acetylmuramoyl-L-alanine amidase